MRSENNSTCCKDDVVSSTVAFITGGILICPSILVSLVAISGAGPRCIQNMVTKLQYADEFSNLLIIYGLITWYGLCLLLLGCFQVLNFEKVFYVILVGGCVVVYFLALFAEFCCGLYVIRSFDRGDFTESLATRLIVGDVNRLLIDDLRAVNVFQDLTRPTARALVIDWHVPLGTLARRETRFLRPADLRFLSSGYTPRVCIPRRKGCSAIL